MCVTVLKKMKKVKNEQVKNKELKHDKDTDQEYVATNKPLTVGLNPQHPENAAGMRTEPPMSEPMPSSDAWLPIRDPSPPLEPPGIRVGSYGFKVWP